MSILLCVDTLCVISICHYIPPLQVCTKFRSIQKVNIFNQYVSIKYLINMYQNVSINILIASYQIKLQKSLMLYNILQVMNCITIPNVILTDSKSWLLPSNFEMSI